MRTETQRSRAAAGPPVAAYPRAGYRPDGRDGRDGNGGRDGERAGHGERVGHGGHGTESSWDGPPQAAGQPSVARGRPVDAGGMRRRRRQAQRPWYVREAALTLLLAMVAVGLVVVSQDYWRRGLLVVGVTLVGAGVLRLFLPSKAAGLLAVRSRVFDVVMLLVLGFAVVGLTLAVPAPGSS